MLADIFSLHGQETLQLRALETAAGLASVSEGNCDTQDGKHVQSGMNNRDEVVNRFALAGSRVGAGRQGELAVMHGCERTCLLKQLCCLFACRVSFSRNMCV